MLQIGFSSKYFTLWNVSSRVDYDAQGRPTEHASYNYIQNLSIVEESAIEKAKEMGVTDLVPDPDLYGRNKSWSREKKLYSDLPRSTSPFFEYGKYGGKVISEVDDLSYIRWYFDDCRNIHCKRILLEKGIIFEHNGEIVSGAFIQSMEVIKSLKNTKTIEVIFDRNLSPTPYSNDGIGTAEINGSRISFLFTDIKINSYNGFEYGLPTIKGKGKRIKNKVLELTIEPITGDDQDGDFLVTEFKILK